MKTKRATKMTTTRKCAFLIDRLTVRGHRPLGMEGPAAE
jgi:hypothetical protein